MVIWGLCGRITSQPVENPMLCVRDLAKGAQCAENWLCPLDPPGSQKETSTQEGTTGVLFYQLAFSRGRESMSQHLLHVTQSKRSRVLRLKRTVLTGLFQSFPHLIGVHGARPVHVDFPVNFLEQAEQLQEP